MYSLLYPKLADTVPFYAVLLYGILAPVFIILVNELYLAGLFRKNKKISIEDRFKQLSTNLFHTICLFAFGIATVLLLTEIGKKAVGQLRPHFLSVCLPDFTKINCNQIFAAISTGDSFCRGNRFAVEEARLSFPSGHASFSAYTMLFLALYLEARFSQREMAYLKGLLQVAAFGATLVVSLSRIADHVHRFSDVVGGVLLGVVVALAMLYGLGAFLWEERGNKEDTEMSRHLFRPYNQPAIESSYKTKF